MKYKLLLISLLCATSSIFSINQNYLIENFKQDLFYSQRCFNNNKAKYYKFINPYIQEAERSLDIIKYISTTKEIPTTEGTSSNSTIRHYMQALLNYNVCFFKVYAKSLKTSKSLENASNKLWNSIIEIKENLNLENLDANEEFNTTIALFEKVNRAYYNWLPSRKKFLIKITNIF